MLEEKMPQIGEKKFVVVCNGRCGESRHFDIVECISLGRRCKVVGECTYCKWSVSTEIAKDGVYCATEVKVKCITMESKKSKEEKPKEKSFFARLFGR